MARGFHVLIERLNLHRMKKGIRLASSFGIPCFVLIGWGALAIGCDGGDSKVFNTLRNSGSVLYRMKHDGYSMALTLRPESVGYSSLLGGDTVSGTYEFSMRGPGLVISNTNRFTAVDRGESVSAILDESYQIFECGSDLFRTNPIIRPQSVHYISGRFLKVCAETRFALELVPDKELGVELLVAPVE